MNAVLTVSVSTCLISAFLLLGLLRVQFYFSEMSYFTASVFTLKNPAEESMKSDRGEEEDDFQTDEDEEMEVDKQVVQKRKKVREMHI